jgi:hypothetical protein
MLLIVALSSGFPLPTKIVKEGILFPVSAALLTGRFFRLGSAKTNKAGVAKTRDQRPSLGASAEIQYFRFANLGLLLESQSAEYMLGTVGTFHHAQGMYRPIKPSFENVS